MLGRGGNSGEIQARHAGTIGRAKHRADVMDAADIIQQANQRAVVRQRIEMFDLSERYYTCFEDSPTAAGTARRFRFHG